MPPCLGSWLCSLSDGMMAIVTTNLSSLSELRHGIISSFLSFLSHSAISQAMVLLSWLHLGLEDEVGYGGLTFKERAGSHTPAADANLATQTSLESHVLWNFLNKLRKVCLLIFLVSKSLWILQARVWIAQEDAQWRRMLQARVWTAWEAALWRGLEERHRALHFLLWNLSLNEVEARERSIFCLRWRQVRCQGSREGGQRCGLWSIRKTNSKNNTSNYESGKVGGWYHRTHSAAADLLQREPNYALSLSSPLHTCGNRGTSQLSENVPLKHSEVWGWASSEMSWSARGNRWRAQSWENLSDMVVNVNTFLTHQLVKLQSVSCLLIDWAVSPSPWPLNRSIWHLDSGIGLAWEDGQSDQIPLSAVCSSSCSNPAHAPTH